MQCMIFLSAENGYDYFIEFTAVVNAIHCMIFLQVTNGYDYFTE